MAGRADLGRCRGSPASSPRRGRQEGSTISRAAAGMDPALGCYRGFTAPRISGTLPRRRRKMTDKKKSWSEPELILIVRGKPEGAVLTACKGTGASGPTEE